MSSDGGKGSAPRPFSVDQKTFEDNWDRIFKRQKELKDSVDNLNKDLDRKDDVKPKDNKRKA